MTLALSKRTRRPWWMTTFGREPMGDIFFDRLWPEYERDMGEEVTPAAYAPEYNSLFHAAGQQHQVHSPVPSYIENFYSWIEKKNGKKEKAHKTDHCQGSAQPIFCWLLPVDLSIIHP